MTSTPTVVQPDTRAPRLALPLGPVTVPRLLALDAAACAALGVVGVVGAGALDGPLGAPTTLLVAGGVALLLYAVEAGLGARRPSRRGLLSLVAANTAFAAASVVVAVGAGLSTAGVLVAGGLAAVSIVVADLLVMGLRGDAGRA